MTRYLTNLPFIYLSHNYLTIRNNYHTCVSRLHDRNAILESSTSYVCFACKMARE